MSEELKEIVERLNGYDFHVEYIEDLGQYKQGLASNSSKVREFMALSPEDQKIVKDALVDYDVKFKDLL